MKINKRKINKILNVVIIILMLLFISLITMIFLNLYANTKSNNENNSIPTFNELTNENELKENIDVNEKTNVNNNNNNINSNNNEKTEKNTKDTYYIKVNNQSQVVTIYTKDDDGKYTVPVKAMICSTGSETPTSGVYRTPIKYKWRALFGEVYGQYATRIINSILFHSVPYFDYNDKTSLEYLEYDKLGTNASAGCVRLTVIDAKWIYDNCEIGTQVEFYSSPNPGPLGKPTAKKISDYPDYLRNWDPTDPDPKNPWHTYNESN